MKQILDSGGNLLHRHESAVNESDVLLAGAAKGKIIFTGTMSEKLTDMAAEFGVKLEAGMAQDHLSNRIDKGH